MNSTRPSDSAVDTDVAGKEASRAALRPLHRRGAPRSYVTGTSAGPRWDRSLAHDWLGTTDESLASRLDETQVEFMPSQSRTCLGEEAFLNAPVEELWPCTRPTQYRGSINRIGVELSENGDTAQALMTESRLEASAVRHFSWLQETVAIGMHPAVISFVLPDGTTLRHVPDVLVEDRNGTRRLINVKPRVFWDPVFALQSRLMGLWCERWGAESRVYSEPSEARIRIQELIRNHTTSSTDTRRNAQVVLDLLFEPRSCHFLAHRVGSYGLFQPALMYLLAHHQVSLHLNAELRSYTRVMRGQPEPQDHDFLHSSVAVVSHVKNAQQPSARRLDGSQ